MIKVENYKVLIEGEFLEIMMDFVSIASAMKDEFPEEVCEAMRAVFNITFDAESHEKAVEGIEKYFDK